MKHHCNYYQACKEINKLLILAADKIAPKLCCLDADAADEIRVNNNIESYNRVMSELNALKTENKYWKRLYTALISEYVESPITYAEYVLFTSYFKYGHELFDKPVKNIRFAL